ncbi:S1/P1 nuclease [Rhizobium sp. PEPV16]|uniref:S1/P1 nuclease n=1 Tax=Rhizobium sp. PEPV16 TaxID=1820614 RepID=UPI0015E1B9B0|nr:S1/P1 nuclease [Rhizobium sp. PEPV16]KAF5881711.1 hypothetical protein FY112_29205 [Rhizobium sp. PEPV16]
MTEGEIDPVNLETQIVAFTTALPASSGLPDSVRSNDLVWLLHLVGDAHQPLHASARFSKALKKGDQGGNLIDVTPPNGQAVKLLPVGMGFSAVTRRPPVQSETVC